MIIKVKAYLQIILKTYNRKLQENDNLFQRSYEELLLRVPDFDKNRIRHEIHQTHEIPGK